MGSARGVLEFSRAFLGGRPGVCVLLKAYFDESGTHDGAPVVTVGAYLARPTFWAEWTKKWNVAKKPIKVFHSADAANLRGEFAGWTAAARDDLVKRLLPTIATRGIVGMVVGIHLDAFREALAPHGDLSRLIGSPYTTCFQWALQGIMSYSIRYASKQRIAFVHEVNEFKADAFKAFEYVRENVNPNGIKLTLAFADKDDLVPLQAADVLAYEANKRFRDPTKAARRSWLALQPDRYIRTRYFGKENMHLLVDLMLATKADVAAGKINVVFDDGTSPDWGATESASLPEEPQ